MSARPTVSIYSASGEKIDTAIPLPHVFKAPVRPDLVKICVANMAKNKRQAYAVSEKAGHQTSAESWGTGRAVARIPRVSGGGTHRAGQAAFGNMCRGGRMFAPTKVWRKWHVAVNQKERRAATASALAASAIPSLVLARGHRVSSIPELPLVLSTPQITKTKDALALLKTVGAYADIEKVVESKKLRAGKGKLRNRRHRMRKGPLVIHNGEKDLAKAFRNVPGVELSNVNALNVLQLAPGGHLGRFVIWTSSAFSALDKIYSPSGSTGTKVIQAPMVTIPDLARLINSDEIQSVLRPANESKTKRPWTQHKNPLKNMGVLARLNPYAVVSRRADILAEKKRAEGKAKRTQVVNKNRSNAKFLETLKSD